MARFIALIFAVAAGWRLWRDWQGTVDAGETFAMVPLGTYWAELSPGSLQSVQSLASGMLSPEAQASALNVPLAAVLVVAAALFWFFGRGPAPKRKQFGR